MKNICLLISLLLAIGCSSVKEGSNRFSQFEGKEYGSYHYALRDTLRKVYATDSEECVEKAIEEMMGLKSAHRDKQWQLEAEFLRLNFYHDYRNGDDDKFVGDLLKLKEKARKAGNRVFVIRITRRLMDHYVEKVDQINEVRYACMLERESEGITEEEFPDIIDNDYRLATLFLRYNSPNRAMPHLEVVLNHKVVPEIELIFLDARNDIAILSRDTDMKKSDSLFLSIIADTTITDRKYWCALATANLGTNALFSGDYKRATELLSKGFYTMEEFGDAPLCSGIASNLCRSYCRLGNAAKAGEWCRTSEKYGRMSSKAESAFHKEMYSCMTEYESLVGNHNLAQEYLDSCILATSMPYSRWSPSIITEIESFLDEDLLEAEQRTSRIRMAAAGVTGLMTIILAACSVFLYSLSKRRKQMIRALSIQAETWAHEHGSSNNTGTGHIETILNYLESSKKYLEKDCSLETIAKATLLNRSYVSKAVNENYKNFNWMLNSLRIREVIKMLDKDSRTPIEDLKESCGFGSTSSLYEAFKSVTGISIKEYRQSIHKKEN